MSSAATRSLPILLVALVVAACASIALTDVALGPNPSPLGPGDYPGDAAPAINALAQGDFSGYRDSSYVMGPFSVLLRAPAAAIAGQDLAAFQWGTFLCLLAAGLLGLYLARLARRRGATRLLAAALALACVVNPLTFGAIELGHPEEVLTAALAVGAVAVAAEGHGWRAALLLGLALACKQWAVIAILPVLMALPSRRLHVGLVACAVAALLCLPAFLASPGGFLSAQEQVAASDRFVSAWNVWYPVAGETSVEVVEGVGGEPAQVYEGGSTFLEHVTHPLIILIALAVPLIYAFRRRSLRLSGAEAMAMLALVSLLRCVLDPGNNLYYHEPLLLALIGWGAFAPRVLPTGVFAAVVAAALFWQWSLDIRDPNAFNAAYLVVLVPAGVAIAAALGRMNPGTAEPTVAASAGAQAAGSPVGRLSPSVRA